MHIYHETLIDYYIVYKSDLVLGIALTWQDVYMC